VYHLELRKFPHVVCRFNQSEAQLRALVIPWTRQEWIEEGERKWNINEATLTILEGPKLSMPELAMGKGWRSAQKRSEDVTERVLGAAQKAGETQEQDGVASSGLVAEAGNGAEGRAVPGARPGGAPQARAEARELDLLADSLGLELLALLDSADVAPSRVWSMAQERLRERGGVASATEALALAERAIGSLLGRGLAVLRGDGDSEGNEKPRSGERGEDDGPVLDGIDPGREETVLAAIETWAVGRRPPVTIARKI
jgi:hypothetical protein